MMRADGRSQARIKESWKVLSVVLSWAAGSHEVPEIQTNGCILANERTSNRRRSFRAGSIGRSRESPSAEQRRRAGRSPAGGRGDPRRAPCAPR
jgi:hypothetical protein